LISDQFCHHHNKKHNIFYWVDSQERTNQVLRTEEINRRILCLLDVTTLSPG